MSSRGYFLLSSVKSAPKAAPKFVPKSVRRFVNAFVLAVFTLGSVAHASPGDRSSVSDRTEGSLHVESSEVGGLPVQVQLETRFVSPGESAKVLAEGLSTTAETIVVSSDDEPTLLEAAKVSETGSRGRVFLLPFGKLVKKTAQAAGGVNEAIKFSGQYFVNTFKKDWIGVTIATFTLGNEVIRWVHVSSVSNFVVASNIVYASLWAAIFLDKDTWSKTTKPIQRTFRKLFGLSQVIPDRPSLQDTALKFAAGLTLSLALNSGRVAIVGIDQFTQSIFDPMKLAMPLVMGAVMTSVGFSWSEMIGAIDEKVTPRAKKITRVIINARSCLISYVAASAMLMNPADYGYKPWLYVTISGITGLVLYSKVKQLTSLLEWRPKAQRERMRAQRCEAVFGL